MRLKKTCGDRQLRPWNGDTMDGCGRTAWFWADGWEWEKWMGSRHLHCPQCIAKHRSSEEEVNRAAEAEEQKLRARLETEEGSRDYLTRAHRSPYFGFRNDDVETADFERLGIALGVSFRLLRQGNFPFKEAILKVYLEAIQHSKIRAADVYDVYGSLRSRLRARDAAWTRVQQTIEDHLRALPPDLVRSLRERLKDIISSDYAIETENYYICLRNEAMEQADTFLLSVAPKNA